MKKTLAVLLSILLLLTALTGCGSSSQSTDTAAAAVGDTKWEMEEGVAEDAVEEPMELETISTTAQEPGEDALTEETTSNFTEKLIYSGHVYLEVTLFDNAINALEQAVSSFGGFVEASSVNGSTVRNSDGSTSVVDRWGYYVVRVPAESFEEFLSMANGIGNVTSSSRTAENVTSQYTDYEARLSSLYTQEERLLAMLKESSDLESLIQLESRLSEVRYEIESIEWSLRNLDQQVAYSTVTLELQEVEIYTPTVTVKRSFGEKLGDALADGWKSFVRGFQSFVVGVAYILPGMILFLCAAAAVLLIAQRIFRKKRQKQEKSEKEQNTEE